MIKSSEAVGSLKEIMRAKDVSRNIKIKLYRTIRSSTVLCGCKVWVLNKILEEKGQKWERKILRGIFGGKKIESRYVRRTNEKTMFHRFHNLFKKIGAQPYWFTNSCEFIFIYFNVQIIFFCLFYTSSALNCSSDIIVKFSTFLPLSSIDNFIWLLFLISSYLKYVSSKITCLEETSFFFNSTIGNHHHNILR